MKKERYELERELYYIIEKYNRNEDVKVKVVEFLKERVIEGNTRGILNNNTPLGVLKSKLLYHFTDAMYVATEEKNINPDDYFLDSEKSEAADYYEKLDEVEKYPIVFKDAEEMNNDHYHVKLTVQEIAELYNRMVIIYNPETQRKMHQVEKNGLIFEEIRPNPRSLKEISEELLNGTFIANDNISINLLVDGTDDWKYNDKSKTLKIISGKLNIIDGYHRSLGILTALEINPNLKYKFGVNITRYNKKKAKKLIYQSFKRNDMSDSDKEDMNPDSLENEIIKNINENSDMKGKIVLDKILIDTGRALVENQIISKAIKGNFKYSGRAEALIVADWLNKCFDYLIYLKPDAFRDNIKKVQDTSMINKQNMFIGYIALFAKIQEDSNWRDILKTKIEEIENIEAEILKEIGITKKELKPKDIKNISEFFKAI